MELKTINPALLKNDLTMPPCKVDVSNEKVEIKPETEEEKTQRYISCVKDIQGLFYKGYSKENGNDLINYIQKQRSLILELMLENFMRRADPKIGDAINTLMGQMEKSVRDDRKEAMQNKQMETSKETFALFAKSLSAVTDGSIVIPNYGAASLLLDPMKPLIDPKEMKLKPEELVQGNVLVDDKKLEEEIINQNPLLNGSEVKKE